MGSEQNPAQCNQGLLTDLAALSNQVNNPVAPFPVMYSTGSCGGGGGVAVGSSFPLWYFPVNCTSNTVPTPSDNCLRIIENTDGHIGPDYDQTIAANQVNVLPNADNSDNNIFVDPTSKLYSWYVPYGYRMMFFHNDIRNMTLKAAFATNDYLVQGPNTLVVDACLNFLTLASGKTFFSYGNPGQFGILPVYNPGNSTNVTCPLAYCAACVNVGQQIPAGPNCASGPADRQPCPSVTHYAPYFLILKEGTFSDLLLDACVSNKVVTYGDDPSNSLNKVWKPQSDACDNYITTLCGINDIVKSPYAELCSCFSQQQALNVQYGNQLEVPVCCFGQDPSGDQAKSCFFNTDAYKTGQMIQNCCTFAECGTLVEQNDQMKVKASPPGEIQCVGNFVQFSPVPPVSPFGPMPTVIVADSSTIPIYTWIVFAIAITLLLLFVFVLLFV